MFGESLKRAAEMTNAWVITDGAHEGIGGLVGAHASPAVCIGVQSWLAVADHERLVESRTSIMPRSLLNGRPSRNGLLGEEALDQSNGSSFGKTSFQRSRSARLPGSLQRSFSRNTYALSSLQEMSSLPLTSGPVWPPPPPPPPSPPSPSPSQQQRQQRQPRQQQQQQQQTSPSFSQQQSSQSQSQSQPLTGDYVVHIDPSHSHFLLLDAGPNGSRSTAGEFRSTLESYIISTQQSREGYRVPSVTVVVNGDALTLRTVHDRLRDGLPVVALGDTGGAASDLFQYYLHPTFPQAGPPKPWHTQAYLPRSLRRANRRSFGVPE